MWQVAVPLLLLCLYAVIRLKLLGEVFVPPSFQELHGRLSGSLCAQYFPADAGPADIHDVIGEAIGGVTEEDEFPVGIDKLELFTVIQDIDDYCHFLFPFRLDSSVSILSSQ